jgi:hypothetical protein
MSIMSNQDAGYAHGAQNGAGASSWQAENVVTPFLRERTDRALALKRVALPAGEARQETEALPMLATAGDVREVVRLLKRKAGGITIIEGMDAVKRIFDPRKVAAYEYWGLVTRKGDRLCLSALGWEFARRLEPEAQLFRNVLSATLAYRSALEWMFGQRLEIVTDADVAAFWLERPAEVPLSGNQKTVEGNVVCFFHLCQEAELGMATLGKRGQPARLRVDREELAAYIARDSSPTHDERSLHITTEETRTPIPALAPQALPLQRATATASAKPRVFISYRKETLIIKQLQMALELAGIENEASMRTKQNAQLMPDEIFAAMRRCDAAIIVVTGDDDDQTQADGTSAMGERLMLEIAAALIHYNRRLILLWDESVPLPTRLSDLCCQEFAGDSLTWESGLQLLKTLRSFKP